MWISSTGADASFYLRVLSRPVDGWDLDPARNRSAPWSRRPWFIGCLQIKQCTLLAASETSCSRNNFKCKYNLNMKIYLWALGLSPCCQSKWGQRNQGVSLQPAEHFWESCAKPGLGTRKLCRTGSLSTPIHLGANNSIKTDWMIPTTTRAEGKHLV